jgi:acetyltransferase-like isoleucine patch superfamily enzyme
MPASITTSSANPEIMFRKLYLSPMGIFLSLLMHLFRLWPGVFMIYGYFNRKPFSFRKNTRVSSSAILSYKSKITLADHIWIGHYCLLDGIGGIEIGEGVHLASHTCIYTHSSHDAIRLLGQNFIEIPAEIRPAYHRAPVSIGKYTFVGTHCVILPGVKIGQGCIIGAGSVVARNVADYAIVAGNPAEVKGSTREADEKLLEQWKTTDSYYLTRT